jgi:YVTN family beta-propeller protein
MNKELLRYPKTALTLLAGFSLLFSSCKKDNDMPPEPEISSTKGVYMLSEGNFGSKGSDITYYDINAKTTQRGYYKKVNGADLGENAVDLQRYGSKMYCVVSGKNKGESFVDIMDVVTAKTIKRISFNSATAAFFPRALAFYKNKAYVSCYDGRLRRIDTASLTVDAETEVPTYSEGIAAANGKLYVANSDYLINGSNTVSVVDLATFRKVKDIIVNINPVKIAAAPNGDVYVISQGDYYTNIPGNLERISSITDTKVSTTTVTGIDYNSSIYITTNSAFVARTNSAFSSVINPVNLSTDIVGNNNFINDGTSIKLLYGLTVDAFNNDVYVADAISYLSTTGIAYCFGADGKKKFSFETSQNPQHAVFIYNYKN